MTYKYHLKYLRRRFRDEFLILSAPYNMPWYFSLRSLNAGCANKNAIVYISVSLVNILHVSIFICRVKYIRSSLVFLTWTFAQFVIRNWMTIKSREKSNLFFLRLANQKWEHYWDQKKKKRNVLTEKKNILILEVIKLGSTLRMKI